MSLKESRCSRRRTTAGKKKIRMVDHVTAELVALATQIDKCTAFFHGKKNTLNEASSSSELQPSLL
jgi:hypothetical protein